VNLIASDKWEPTPEDNPFIPVLPHFFLEHTDPTSSSQVCAKFNPTDNILYGNPGPCVPLLNFYNNFLWTRSGCLRFSVQLGLNNKCWKAQENKKIKLEGCPSGCDGESDGVIDDAFLFKIIRV
jgi:hypothetical protein